VIVGGTVRASRNARFRSKRLRPASPPIKMPPLERQLEKTA
jgi:hypothetical protein